MYEKITYVQTVQTQIRLLNVYTVCHSTKYFQKQLHKKQNLGQKVWKKVFKILGHLLYHVLMCVRIVDDSDQMLYLAAPDVGLHSLFSGLSIWIIWISLE